MWFPLYVWIDRTNERNFLKNSNNKSEFQIGNCLQNFVVSFFLVYIYVFCVVWNHKMSMDGTFSSLHTHSLPEYKSTNSLMKFSWNLHFSFRKGFQQSVTICDMHATCLWFTGFRYYFWLNFLTFLFVLSVEFIFVLWFLK